MERKRTMTRIFWPAGHVRVLWQIRQSEWPLWQKMSEGSRREALSGVFKARRVARTSSRPEFRSAFCSARADSRSIRICCERKNTRNTVTSFWSWTDCDENFLNFFLFPLSLSLSLFFAFPFFGLCLFYANCIAQSLSVFYLRDIAYNAWFERLKVYRWHFNLSMSVKNEEKINCNLKHCVHVNKKKQKKIKSETLLSKINTKRQPSKNIVVPCINSSTMGALNLHQTLHGSFIT